MTLKANPSIRLPGGAVAIIDVLCGSDTSRPLAVPLADKMQRVERTLAGLVSAADVITPSGKHELLVVMESHVGAKVVMEQCFEALSAAGPAYWLSVCIGLAIDPRGTTPQEMMWEKAEEAVSRARAAGGAQIVVVESDGLVRGQPG